MKIAKKNIIEFYNKGEDVKMNNEIPKNTLNIASSVQKSEALVPKSDSVPAVEPAKTKEINEIPENPADRASIKADNLENDIKTFVSNPELIDKALAITELAAKNYADAGIKDAELKALAVGKAFADEFQR